MKYTIGILTINSKILDNLRASHSEERVITYRNMDNIRKEEQDILVVDSEIFESPDSIQFYLSRIRKKVQDTPVLLIHRVSRPHEIEKDWFFNDFILFPFRKGNSRSGSSVC